MVTAAPVSRPHSDPAGIEQFRDTGYCLVDGLFSADEIAAIESFFEEFKT